MLIEINLLPKKEARNFASIVVIVAPLLFVLLVVSLFLLQQKDAQQEIATLKNSIQTTKLTRVTYEQKLTSFKASESIVQLQNTVDWMDSTSVKSVPILEHLTALLPERGSIQNFNYGIEGNIQVTVQFDTFRQAAYYLKEMKDSSNFTEVTIVSLLTNQLLNENEQISTVEKVANETYIPRYVAVYDITINQEALLDQQKEGKK
ncbi:hypothetical protein ACOI1C_03435 [Bacillus sp. DJP31]|uniref:hypothetical protein n=1 Tax=Bacillus sp. DJP31 TaxID=3409789 RepID=UPI003BB7AC19